MLLCRWIATFTAASIFALACQGKNATPSEEDRPTRVSDPTAQATEPGSVRSLEEIPAESWMHFNARDFEAFGALHQSDAVWIEADAEGPHRGRDAIVEHARARIQPFSDLQGEPVMVLADPQSGRILELALVTGTHTGPLSDIPATAMRFGVLTATLFEVEDGLVARRWSISDPDAQLGQLGLIQRPIRPAILKPWQGPQTVMATADSAENANRTRAERFYKAFNAHKIDAIMDAHSKDAVVSDHSLPEDLRGKDAIERHTKVLFGAFPDFEAELEGMFAAGSHVVAWGRWGGTNRNAARSWGLVEPTGERADVAFLELLEFQKGKFIKVTRFVNGFAFAQQLGLRAKDGGTHPRVQN